MRGAAIDAAPTTRKGTRSECWFGGRGVRGTRPGAPLPRMVGPPPDTAQLPGEGAMVGAQQPSTSGATAGRSAGAQPPSPFSIPPPIGRAGLARQPWPLQCSNRCNKCQASIWPYAGSPPLAWSDWAAVAGLPLRGQIRDGGRPAPLVRRSGPVNDCGLLASYGSFAEG